MTDDMRLLQEYVNGSEKAFAELVNRHVDLVYSAALRQTQNSHLSQEITQVVFIILARKAGSIRKNTVLAGWLFRTTRFAVNDALKKEIRRQRREQEAHMQSMLNEPESEPQWQQVSPLLDEAIAELGEKDRNALLLRFFEKKNFNEVGGALGMNEETAKKRVSRAIEKLRKFFTKRGTVLPAVTLISVLSANSVSAAPIGLASTIAASAILKGTVVASSTLTLIKGTLEIMAWTKAKTVAAIGAAVIIGGGTTAVVVKEVVLPAFHQNSSDDDSLWQINSLNLDRQPRIILIRPTRFPKGGGWVMSGERMLGQNASIGTLMQVAHRAAQVRTILPPDLPEEKFDFLVNLPTGGRKEFQEQLRKQFGLTARRETREMDALVLKVKTPGASGLKISQSKNGGTSGEPGRIKIENQPVETLISYLEQIFKIPVIDRTGLKSNYDFELKWLGGDSPDQIEPLKRALAEHLGLELVPSRERMEMLIVERAQN